MWTLNVTNVDKFYRGQRVRWLTDAYNRPVFRVRWWNVIARVMFWWRGRRGQAIVTDVDYVNGTITIKAKGKHK